MGQAGEVDGGAVVAGEAVGRAVVAVGGARGGEAVVEAVVVVAVPDFDQQSHDGALSSEC